jgi:intracellular septation protein A
MNNLIRAALPIVYDSLGVIVFAIMLALHMNLVVAALVGVTLAAGVVVRTKWKGETIQALQWMSLGLVLVSAAATLLTNDPRFMMAKGTFAYTVAGIAMLRKGWLAHYMPPIVMANAPDLVTAYGFVWAVLMLLTSGINLVIAIHWPEWWTTFIAVFPLVSKIILFLIQYVILRMTIRARLRAAV